MILWEDEAIILSYQNYSETSIILKVFTQNLGVRKGFIKGAKSKNKNYIFESGNLLSVSYRARTEDMLGSFSVEMLKSCSAIYTSSPLKFSGIISILNLIEYCLLENETEYELYGYSKKLIHKIMSSDNSWLSDYVLWEIFLLKKVGFGLELSKCALTNQTTNLRYVSPKSGCAVSDEVPECWKNRLFILPKFLVSENKATLRDIKNGFKITTYFLKKFSVSINKTLPFTRDDFIDRILQ